MTEQELRVKLQRALHTRISEPEWRRLKRTGLVDEYQRGQWPWGDFCSLARDDVYGMRDFAEDLRREKAGELQPETEISARAPEPASAADIPALLSDRTAARARALNALDHLRLVHFHSK